MAEISEIWMKEMEDDVRAIRRLIVAAAERTAELEKDPLLNGRKQSVMALRNHLRKLAEDVETLRKDFRLPPADVEESVDTELAESVTAARNGHRVKNEVG